jgi:hypothetical protein
MSNPGERRETGGGGVREDITMITLTNAAREEDHPGGVIVHEVEEDDSLEEAIDTQGLDTRPSHALLLSPELVRQSEEKTRASGTT